MGRFHFGGMAVINLWNYAGRLIKFSNWRLIDCQMGWTSGLCQNGRRGFGGFSAMEFPQIQFCDWFGWQTGNNSVSFWKLQLYFVYSDITEHPHPNVTVTVFTFVQAILYIIELALIFGPCTTLKRRVIETGTIIHGVLVVRIEKEFREMVWSRCSLDWLARYVQKFPTNFSNHFRLSIFRWNYCINMLVCGPSSSHWIMSSTIGWVFQSLFIRFSSNRFPLNFQIMMAALSYLIIFIQFKLNES